MSTDTTPPPDPKKVTLLSVIWTVLSAFFKVGRSLYPYVRDPAIFGTLAALSFGFSFRGGCHMPEPPAPPPPPISLPATVQGPVGRAIVIEATTKGAEVHWWCDESTDLVVMAGTKKAAFVSPKPGKYTVLAWTAIDGVPTDAAVCSITVGDVPPGPGPGPNPDPGPAPIPGTGMRVLIVYPGDPTWKPTSGQLGAMYGGDVLSYLRSKCTKGPDGKTPEFRCYPDNVDLTNESQVWRDALAKAKKDSEGKLPWVLVANAPKGTSEALPADQAAFLKLLQSIGN